MTAADEAAQVERELRRFAPGINARIEVERETRMVLFTVEAKVERTMHVAEQALESGRMPPGRIWGDLMRELQHAAIAQLGIEAIITERLAAEVAKRANLADELAAVRDADKVEMFDLDRGSGEWAHLLGHQAGLAAAIAALRRP